MDSLLQHSHSIMQFYSCECPFAVSLNSTVAMPHVHGSFGATDPHSCYVWLQAFLLWSRWELHSSGPLCSE